MNKILRDYLRKIGRKGGRTVTAKKRASLAHARAVKAEKARAQKKVTR